MTHVYKVIGNFLSNHWSCGTHSAISYMKSECLTAWQIHAETYVLLPHRRETDRPCESRQQMKKRRSCFWLNRQNGPSLVELFQPCHQTLIGGVSCRFSTILCQHMEPHIALEGIFKYFFARSQDHKMFSDHNCEWSMLNRTHTHTYIREYIHLRRETFWFVNPRPSVACSVSYLGQASENSVVLAVAAVFWPTFSSEKKESDLWEPPKS